MTITIVGLGPGSVDDITRRAWDVLEHAKTVYLRTRRHPCVDQLPNNRQYHDFDELYQSHDAFSDVHDAIIVQLLAAAEQGDIVYAVPGDPMVGETITQCLLAQDKVTVEIVHGVSFIEPMLRQAGIDATDGLQVFDGMILAAMHHPPINPQYPALVAQVFNQMVASDVKLTLMNQYPDDLMVTLIHSTGSDAIVEHVPLYEIDRSEHLNHLTSLYVPPLGEYASFEAFMEIIAHLRAPEGCPWDRKQTHESLRPYLIEEAYEVLDAIDKGEIDELAGELGDLLLQIVLHAQIAVDDGEFYMTDILDRINRKMIRRHPHVWGDVNVDGDPDQVVINWEAIKQAEKADNGQIEQGLLDSIPITAPALWVAHKFQDKVAKVGFDWPDVSGVEDKLREEMQEIFEATDPEHKAQEIGDLMFVMVNWLRWLDVDDPESLLRSINQKFYNRFHFIEQQAAGQNRDLNEMTLEEMDAIWDQAKKQGL
ncbi:MAG: nucleoside triphosphate pyrophosphohydrolase [Anaerolineae bacterium]|nr:nucleoside triphosphate pyrophosphohydrolase [Anaerolineae bacterium]